MCRPAVALTPLPILLHAGLEHLERVELGILAKHCARKCCDEWLHWMTENKMSRNDDGRLNALTCPQRQGIDFHQVALLEWSLVSVPAAAGALMEAGQVKATPEQRRRFRDMELLRLRGSP